MGWGGVGLRHVQKGCIGGRKINLPFSFSVKVWFPWYITTLLEFLHSAAASQVLLLRRNDDMDEGVSAFLEAKIPEMLRRRRDEGLRACWGREAASWVGGVCEDFLERWVGRGDALGAGAVGAGSAFWRATT